MKKLVLVVVAVAMALLAAACTKDAVVMPEGGVVAAAATPSEGSASAVADPALAKAINAFGFDLLGKSLASKPGPATVISPVSVHAALSMAANGASGETLDEMRSALHLDSMPEADANQAYANLLTRLNGSTDTTTAIADSLWIDEGFPVKDAFVSANQKYFGAEVRSLDLQDPAAPKAINGWVSDNTNGKIDRIVPDVLPPDKVLEIVNATYFEGEWALPFEPRATRPQLFYFPDGSAANVPMMGQAATWRHVLRADYEAIELPYAGGSTSMIVVQQSPLASSMSGVPQLTGESFGALRAELASSQATEGTIVLPKVEATWSDSLVDELKALSITRVFDQVADLSRLSDVKPLWVDTVTHKTYLRVDEQGTEAAAATEGGVAAGTVSSVLEPFRMIVDQPYLMAIVDNASGAVLFLAAVNDPRAK